MATTAKLNVVFGADLKDFQKGMAQAQRGLADFGKKMTAVGAGLTKTLTLPIVGFLGASTRAFTKQEDAERKLAAAIGATGGAVDSNMIRFKAFASEMQRLTVVGDETVLSLLQIATAQGLSAESSERAAKNAIALQSAFGVNAESAIRMTAALEQGNATMLRRYIPALKGVEDNAMAVVKAQEILTGAFSIAEAEALTFGGQVTQLKNAFGDFMEAIGSVVAEVLTPFVAKAKEVVSNLQNMDSELLKFRVGIAGLIAVVPILMVGIGNLILVFKALNLAMLANPYVLLATGIGLVLFGAFVKLRTETIKTEARLRTINEGMEAQKVAVNDLVDSYKILNAQEAKRNLHQDIVSQTNFIRALEEQNKALQKSIEINNNSIGASRGNAQVIEQVRQKNIELNQAIEDNNQKLGEARQRAIDMVSAFNGMAKSTGEASTALSESVKTIGDLENEISKLKESLKDVNVGDLEKFGTITDKIEALEMQIRRTRNELLVPLHIDIDPIIDDMSELDRIINDINFTDFVDPRSIKAMQMEIAILRNHIDHSFDPVAIQYFQSEIERLTLNIAELHGQTSTIPSAFVALQPIVDNFVNSFGAGMANVVVQGENLIDVLKNIGKLLLSSAIQKGLQLLLMGSGGGGLAVGGLLGALFGKPGAGSPAGFAEGGRPPVGEVSIVGERGPELFIPDQAGTIIPNDKSKAKLDEMRSNPVDLINKSNLIESVNTSNPVDLINKSNLIESVNTSNPVDLINKSNLIESVNKSNLVESVNKLNTVESVNTSNLVDSVNKLNPVESVNTSNLVDSVNKLNPVESVNTSNLVESVNKFNPVESVNTSNLVESVNKFNPVESVNKFNPVVNNELINTESNPVVKNNLNEISTSNEETYSISNMFQNVSNKFSELFSTSSESVFGRAGGGRVNAGQPYMTGEIGSELFIPSVNGSIISHRQLQGMGGSAEPVTVNVNVSGKISGRDLVFLVDNNRRTFN